MCEKKTKAQVRQRLGLKSNITASKQGYHRKSKFYPYSMAFLEFAQA